VPMIGTSRNSHSARAGARHDTASVARKRQERRLKPEISMPHYPC
jgi:hypothetical protein